MEERWVWRKGHVTSHERVEVLAIVLLIKGLWVCKNNGYTFLSPDIQVVFPVLSV